MYPPAILAPARGKSVICMASTNVCATSLRRAYWKGPELGRFLARTEATGYGLCYLTAEMLRCMKNDSFAGKTVVISGSGNVAIYAARRLRNWGKGSGPVRFQWLYS